ncbi:MAG: hypothetical protein R2813_09465 [Flavobacteriales bacterium]
MRTLTLFLLLTCSCMSIAQGPVYSPPFYLYGSDGFIVHLQEYGWTKYSRLEIPEKGVVHASICIDSLGIVRDVVIQNSRSGVLTALVDSALTKLKLWQPGMRNRSQFTNCQINIPFVFGGMIEPEVTDQLTFNSDFQRIQVPRYYTEDWNLLTKNEELVYDYDPNKVIQPSTLKKVDNLPTIDYGVFQLLPGNSAMFHFKPFVIAGLEQLKTMDLKLPHIPPPDIVEKTWESECLPPCEYAKALRLYSTNQFSAAAIHFEAAKRAMLDNSDLYYMKGQCYKQLGKDNKACADWKRAVELGDKPAQEMLNQHCISTN